MESRELRWIWQVFLAILISCPGLARAATTLDLSVTGTASRPPDMIEAVLTARTEAATPAEAQAALNRMVAGALHDIHGVTGVTATTSRYDVSPVYPKQTTWEARQNLDLAMQAAPESKAAKPMLALVARMQASGLTLANLTGTLSASAKRQTMGEAIVNAVKRLREQADIVAGSLGDQVSGITKLSLNAAAPILPLLRAAPMAMAGAPPSISPASVTEHVTLSGTVTLTRRSR